METFCDMLAAIGKGAEKPTHIMYKANLSWNVMQAYLKVLVTQGLVVITPEDEDLSSHAEGIAGLESLRIGHDRPEASKARVDLVAILPDW
jgi:hypothetical protein